MPDRHRTTDSAAPPDGGWRWFRLTYLSRPSRSAHALRTVWTGADAGEAITACGLRPYDYAKRALDLRFGVDPDAPRCHDCAVAIGELVEMAAAA